MNPQVKSYGKAFCWTLLLLGAYWGLRHIPIPTIAYYLNVLPAQYPEIISRFNPAALGLTPVIEGFVFLEIFSFLLKPLARWRLQGVSGREKLNQWAWGLGLLFAFIQAWGSSYFVWEKVGSTPVFWPSGPNFVFHLLNITTFMAGTFVCVWIGRLITQFGVGNGFLILYFSKVVVDLFQGFAWATHQVKKSISTSDLWVSLDLRILLLAMACGFLWQFLDRTPRIPVKRPGRKTLWFEIPPFPAFPQVHYWSVSLISSAYLLLLTAGAKLSWMKEGWPHIVLECALMVPLCLLFYYWAFGDIDLFGLAVDDLPVYLHKRERLLDRRFKQSLGVVVGGSIFFWLPFNGEFGFVSWILDFGTLVLFFAMIRDFWAHWLFWRDHGQGVELMEMDNVHLATYVKGLFEAEGIPCHLQAFVVRRLMFFLGPIYKMRLLVSGAAEARARELLGKVKYQVA